MDDQGLYVTYAVGARDGYVIFRKTLNYVSWQSPILLGRGLDPSIAGDGRQIVVAWARPGDDDRHGRILVRRSLNNGAAFGSTRVVVTSLRDVFDVALASTGGRVAVVWTAPDGLWISMSSDARTWATPALIEPRARRSFGPAMAAGERLWLGYYRLGERFLDVVVRRGQ